MYRCSFCGAGPDNEEPETHYACGNPRQPRSDIYRAGECYEREIANLKERLEIKDEKFEQMMQANNEAIKDLQERLEAWRELYKDYPWKDNQCIEKLKDLGEI